MVPRVCVPSVPPESKKFHTTLQGLNCCNKALKIRAGISSNMHKITTPACTRFAAMYTTSVRSWRVEDIEEEGGGVSQEDGEIIWIFQESTLLEPHPLKV